MSQGLSRTISVVIEMLAVAMLAVSVPSLVVGYELTKWPAWLPFAEFMRVAGAISLLAFFAGFLPGGWGRWVFTLFFGVVGIRLLYGWVPTEYPTDPNNLFALAQKETLFVFGSMHLFSKAKYWWA